MAEDSDTPETTEPETPETTLFPVSDGVREDSGLQDILSVAAKIKDARTEPDASEDEEDDSGLIVFGAASTEDASEGEHDEDALFGSFSGGLGAGFGATMDVGVDAAVEATPAAAPVAPPAEKSNPFVPIAIVLGLAVVLGGGYMLMNNDKGDPAPKTAQAETSAGQQDAAVANPDVAAPGEAAESSAGAGAEETGAEAGETEGALEAVEGETEGALEAVEGETEGVPAGETEGDPLAQDQALLAGDSGHVAKHGKWDKGKSSHHATKPAGDPDPVVDPDPIVDPVVEPVVDPLPEPKANPDAHNDDVDCLLNPDLAKCQGGGQAKKNKGEVLVPKLPEKLSQTQLRAGFGKIKGAAKTCGGKHGASPGDKVKVHVSIEGESGKVTSVTIKGDATGTPLGHCIEQVVKGAKFDSFKKPAMGIDYSLSM